MKPRRLAFAVCALVITLTACAKEEKKKADLPSDGKVEGTLTINGKTFPLKYVYAGSYAGRENRSDPGRAAGLDVMVTNEPLSYEILSNIFLELEVDVYRRDKHTFPKLLKDTSVVALYFEVPGSRVGSSDKPSLVFDGMLMTPEAVSDYSSLSGANHKFSEFSLKDGRIAATAESKWEQTETGADFKAIEIAANYSLSFDAKVSDQSLLLRGLSSENKSWQQALSKLPEEGKAEGAVTRSKRIANLGGDYANLSFAYAQREKWADGKGEGFTVLLTERPVPKEFLLLSFERGLVGHGYGLRLRIGPSGIVRESLITKPDGYNEMFDPTSTTVFKVANGRVVGAAENKQRNADKEDAWDSYSVTFDAPLKN